MSIRWVITDRENGDKITVDHPRSFQDLKGKVVGHDRRDLDNLSSTIKHCSKLELAH